MSTPEEKTAAKAALADLIELIPDKRADWRDAFQRVMKFIKDASAPPEPPKPVVYNRIDDTRTPPADFHLLGQAWSAGALARVMNRDDDLSDLVAYADASSGQIYVDTRDTFTTRMRMRTARPTDHHEDPSIPQAHARGRNKTAKPRT